MEVTNSIQEGFSKEFLSKPISVSSDGNYIIGSFFEELTRILFEGFVERLNLDGSCDVCPDLRETKRREFFIECKAAKSRTYMKKSKAKKIEWKMKTAAIDNYRRFFADYFPDCSLEKPDFNPSLLYTFWGYDLGSKKIEEFGNSNELVTSLTYSDLRLYLIDSTVLDLMSEFKTLGDPPSTEKMFRLWHSDFKLLDKDKWVEFISKWKLPEDCFYTSCEKSGLEVNNKQVNQFPVRVLLSKDSYSKESISNFLENNILGSN